MIEWRILLRRMDGPLPKEEEAEFRSWIESNPGHKIYFERLLEQWDDTAPSPTVLEEVVGEFECFVASRRKRAKRRRLAVAAVAAACCLSGTFIFLHNRFTVETAEVMETIPDGNCGVTIITDGKVVYIDDDGGRPVTVAGAEIDKDKQYIRYDTDVNGSTASNTIAVPRGSEWNVVLPDGTEVKLNAGSRITFRSGLPGAERVVELTGEALFAVKRDRDKPFVVTTDLGRIRVYGTMFNVKRYDDDSNIRITLVEGSLGFTSNTGTDEVMLAPGQRIVYEGTGIPVAEQAKTDVDTAWTQSQFSFEHASLKDIMKTISKWYDVEFVFEHTGLADLTFTGRLNRYEKLGTFLGLFEQAMNLGFTVTGEKTIAIRQK